MRFEKMQVSGYLWEKFSAKGRRLAPDAISILSCRSVDVFWEKKREDGKLQTLESDFIFRVSATLQSTRDSTWLQTCAKKTLEFEGAQRKPYTNERAKRASCEDWRMDGWTVIKSVLRFSSFWCMLKIIYICTYIRTQKLSPRFLWVSKFDVKLRVIDKNFKITAGRWIFFFWV